MSNKENISFFEIADLQREYATLKNTNRLTKKALCDLCIPFRDKYCLKDHEAISIVNGSYSNIEIAKILREKTCQKQ